jgi:LmbE family N-acetylglucosaminyl deacetylase
MVYLSPHFDDVVLSCGGLVWEQLQAGQPVEIWTLGAGVPQEGLALSEFAQQLHERWQTGIEAVATRRMEDETAMLRLGAVARYWDLPDCIYRRLPDGSWLVEGEEDLWQPFIRRKCRL